MSVDAPRRIAYEPALDGMRGLALLAILCYHADFGWAHGFFFSLSMFFTLSGFLITSLLIAEWDSTGNVSLRHFYANRVRRLWPAAVCTLLLITLYARFIAGPSEIIGFRHDVIAAMLQSSNWWFIIDGRSYGALFRSPSLVQHYWSLALEEQFYLFCPPLLVLCLRRGWDLTRMGFAVVAAMAASAMLTIAIAAGDLQIDRIYYGTDTRAIELLVGVLLAIVVARRPAFGPVGLRVIRWGGVAGLGAAFGFWAFSHQSDPWVYRGGFWAYAMTTAVVVLACRVPGPIKSALSWKPLREIGALSYGIYLLHWPIFLWLDPTRLGLSLTTTFIVRVSITLVLAVAMSRLLELPIRRGALGRTGPRWVTPAAALSSIAMLVVLATVVAPSDRAVFNIDNAAKEYERTAQQVRHVLPDAPRVGVFGDSGATALSLGVATWARDTGRIGLGAGGSQIGCGIIVDGGIDYGGLQTEFGSRCAGRTEEYESVAASNDIALVMFGPWDVAGHRLPGDSTWRTIGDPVYDRALLAEANQLIDLMTAKGALVEWILSPEFVQGQVDGRPPIKPYPESDPARIHRFNDLIRGLAKSRSDVRIIDLPAWMRSRPGGELDPKLRPDGVHFTSQTALLVMQQFLGKQILAGVGQE